MRLRNMPSINSHTDSAAFYESAGQWRDPPHSGARKLDSNGQTYKSVRPFCHPLAKDGTAYAWRYHDTDVVRWLTDDHFTICAWESLSTTTFMEALIPSEFYVDMANPWHRLIGLRAGPRPAYPTIPWHEPGHDAAYEAYIKADREWYAGTRWFAVDHHTIDVKRANADAPWVIGETLDFDVPTVNGPKAHAARKRWRTSDFGAWMNAVLAGRRGSRASLEQYALASVSKAATILPENIHANSAAGLAQVRAALDDNASWWSIVASPHLRPPTKWSRGGQRPIARSWEQEIADWYAHIKRSVLLAAYHEAGAVEICPTASLIGRDAVNSAWRLHQRWECDRFNWPVVGTSEGE